MKSNVKMKVVGAAIGLIGFGLLVWQAGWPVAGAVLVMMWGNNLERLSDYQRKRKARVKNAQTDD